MKKPIIVAAALACLAKILQRAWCLILRSADRGFALAMALAHPDLDGSRGYDRSAIR